MATITTRTRTRTNNNNIFWKLIFVIVVFVCISNISILSISSLSNNIYDSNSFSPISTTNNEQEEEVFKKSRITVNKPKLHNLTTDHIVRYYDYYPKTNDRQLPSNKVFMVGPWEPESIIKANIYLSSKLEIHFFNDTSMTRMAKEIDQQLKEQVGLHGSWESYKALRPWAFRADLFRYMILWSQGGIYLDAKMELIIPIETWAALRPNETMAVCEDRPIFNSTTLGKPVQALWNGALSARKGSPVLLESIRLIINTVMERKYVLLGEELSIKQSGEPWLGVTGPFLLGYVAASSPTFSNQVSIPCRKHAEGLSQGSVKIIELDGSVHSSMHKHGGHYPSLYNAGNLYCVNETSPYACNISKLLGS